MSDPATKNKSPDKESQHKKAVENSIGKIFCLYGEQYIEEYKPALHKIKLIRSMRVCKSPAMGGKAIVCKKCAHHHYLYYGCGNSHCPICGSIKREQWEDKLRADLLPVAYVHIIFTLPKELRRLARMNKKEIYNLLMRSSWQTIKELSEKEENIGALPGIISVLHTFGSDMKYHVHTHNLVTFGGYDKRTEKWKSPKRKDKIARYRKMSSRYKEIFLEGLEELYKAGLIIYDESYDQIKLGVADKRWVVHNTKPTLDTRILEQYLSRYINRIAISNSKVEWLEEQQKVKLIHNDYENQKEGEAAPKTHRKFDPLMFIHQFMEHVLPKYFQKTRRYGIQSNASKKKYRKLIPEELTKEGAVIRTVMQIVTKLLAENPYQCEQCESEEYEIVMVLPDKEWIHRYIKVPGRSPPQKRTFEEIIRHQRGIAV